MRILLITSKGLRCGSSLRMLDLARELLSRNQHVFLLVPDEPSWHLQLRREMGANFDFYHLANTGRNHVALFLRGLCKDKEKVVVHAQKREDLSLCIEALKGGHELVALVAGYSVASPLSREAVGTYGDPRIDCVVCVSNASADILSESLASRCPLIRIVHPGVNLDAFNPGGVSNQPKSETPVVGLVANHYRIKRVDIALQAIRILLQERPVRLLSVGSFEDKDMRGYARHLGIEKWCDFTGWQDDVRPWLRRMSVMVLSSQSEGTPGVLLEGMAMGVPVVATGVGGVKEVITDGVTGFLVEPEDPKALAERIATILDKPGLAENMVARARQEVVARFSLACQVEKMIALYAELIEKRSCGVV